MGMRPEQRTTDHRLAIRLTESQCKRLVQFATDNKMTLQSAMVFLIGQGLGDPPPSWVIDVIEETAQRSVDKVISLYERSL